MLSVVMVVVLAAVLGCVAGALQNALRQLSLVRLEKHAGPARMRRLLPVVNNRDGHAIAMAFFRVLCNVTIIAGVFVLMAGGPTEHDGHAFTLQFDHWWRLAAGAVLSAVVIYVLGAVVPISVADHAGERLVVALAGPVRGVYFLAAPLRVFGGLDRAVRRVLGVKLVSEHEELKGEILSLTAEGEREGALGHSERKMIEAIVDFRSRTVEQVMTPRTEIEAMQMTNNLGEVTRLLRDSSHSRIPVYEGNLDHVVGVFYVKDLLRWLAGEGTRGAGKPFNLRQMLRPALFVPETKTIHELLGQLLQQKVHIAVVLDEYGGTSGLVTMEDIVEEIFGDIQDEYERGDDSGIALDAATRSAVLDARVYIADANERLGPAVEAGGLGVRFPESEDYDTVGGWLLTRLGRIPAAGEVIDGPAPAAGNGAAAANGSTPAAAAWTVRVLEAEPTRVLRLQVQAQVPEGVAGAAGGGAAAGGEGAQAG
ncbi:MAG: HlyC/CorC family transporter [Phycisphaerales bacterium]|nr:HlyC/CorC family transporter [Phycisphaerales bacterium]